MNLLTLDVETTLNGPEHDKGNPCFPNNHVVLLGTLSHGLYSSYTSMDAFVSVLPTQVDFVVGCNIAFDLLYLYKYSGVKQKLQKQRLWDIQLADYLLSGQQNKWPSLDEMSVKHGLPVKDNAVTKYFEQGLGADKVPKEMLEDYLKQDVYNTETIAKIQIEQAVEQNMLPLIISQMEALHCTVEMTFNGLNIDMEYYRDYAAKVAMKFSDTKNQLSTWMSKYLESLNNYYYVDDVDSNLQWSKFFFGGVRKVETKEVVGLYKNGKLKTKKVVKEVKTVPFISDVAPLQEWVSEKTGKISVDEKVLEYLKSKTTNVEVVHVLTYLLEFRDLTKQLSTYVQGLSKHVIEHDLVTSVIHGRLNHTATATGRLSSTSPNLQNISNNPIKKIFNSRYGDKGNLVEFDFQQLEVAVLAHITKDKQLIKDISSGKDIHTELYVDMFHVKPTKDERKWFKRLTFGLIYGAGPKTLSDNAGCTIDVAKSFVEAFYRRYPYVKIWNEQMALDADRGGVHEELKMGSVAFSKTWRYKSETGRTYVFKQYKNKFADSTWSTSRGEYTYSPTELKNYPVQGLATGDIVPMMLGILFRKFINKKGVRLVNTVHDSILFDVHNDVLDVTIKEVFNVLNNTHEYFNRSFKSSLALKLTAGCSVGKNWFEMKEL